VYASETRYLTVTSRVDRRAHKRWDRNPNSAFGERLISPGPTHSVNCGAAAKEESDVGDLAISFTFLVKHGAESAARLHLNQATDYDGRMMERLRGEPKA
jgi:hypothetical protein